MKYLIILPLTLCIVLSAPRSRIYPEQTPPQLLTLPSNATSIRAEITDSFTCEGRSYGYYADTDNDCQIFHVCLPVVYSHTRSQMFKWSFICPEETIFNQEIFTCVNADESIDCMESPKFYSLNSHFGERESETEEAHHVTDGTTLLPEMLQGVEKSGRRHAYDSKRKTLESVYNY